MKFLYQPVSPWHINQRFGENSACEATDGSRQVITCDGTKPPKGYVSLYGPEGHKGMDVRAGHGQAVYCAADGVVDFIDTQERSGLDVRVVTEVDGVRYRHIYEHLLGYNFKVGEEIKKGQVIGWADNTGYSSGDHLHFQLEKWVEKKKGEGEWVAIDPEPFLFPVFAPYHAIHRLLLTIIADLSEKLTDKLRSI